MKKLPKIAEIDRMLIQALNRFSLPALQLSLGVIFIWFGALKPFGDSPANEVITKTVYWFDPDIFIPILGVWEMAIGICLLVTPLIRVGLFLLALQMPGTFLPLVLRPEICFIDIPFNLTLEGQYIIKNLVLIGAAIVVGSRLVPLAEKRIR
ncbi:MAG: hypothetical protein F2658_03780 [Actinobacteria bacterium]|jgi:uncharacterized membrane protein YkgB|uniref:Unannotated protein n=1 Tax=freshwater metagenome TaxID=449393 RepID=A0A6J6NKB0_9ZZZZ|nr:hypothetical protein [Actinomycetota bacterium]